jgi:hypothetical protein
MISTFAAKKNLCVLLHSVPAHIYVASANALSVVALE